MKISEKIALKVTIFFCKTFVKCFTENVQFFCGFCGDRKNIIDLFLPLEKSNNNLILFVNTWFTVFYKQKNPPCYRWISLWELMDSNH